MHSLLVFILEYLETFPLLVIAPKTHSRPLFSRIHEKHRITNGVWMVVRGKLSLLAPISYNHGM
jgi:hypothetical protein